MDNIREALQAAYRWGRDNGEGRSDKNFNDFMETTLPQTVLTQAGQKFTLDEISNYLESQDSFGDVFYYLSSENIRKANQ